MTCLYVFPMLHIRVFVCLYVYIYMHGYVIASEVGAFRIHDFSFQWRHNESDCVSNYQPHDCLLSRLFRRRSKKTPKLHVTGLCAGNSPGTGEFPAQMASNAENVSIWWRHHILIYTIRSSCLTLAQAVPLIFCSLLSTTGNPDGLRKEDLDVLVVYTRQHTWYMRVWPCALLLRSRNKMSWVLQTPLINMCYLTTHLFAIERVDGPKLHDMLKHVTPMNGNANFR